jgi:hypothetical protein
MSRGANEDRPRSSPEADYYVRVRPVVGEILAQRRLAVWDLSFGYLAAEALARTGLRDQLWFDSPGLAGDAFCRSLGGRHRGRPRANALAEVCREHNHFESSFHLEGRPAELGHLRRALRGEDGARPHLLLAHAGPGAAELARAAIDEGIPFVLSRVPRGAAAGAAHLVWLPESASDLDSVIAAAEELSALPGLDLDELASHVDGLEARSTALALAKWILLRAGPARSARPDLERPLLAEGRNLLLRGDPSWPWAVRFLRPARETVAVLAAGPARFRTPLGLLRSSRLLVLGLGTGSLFCAEAASFFRTLHGVDCKAVSAVNPVRQIYPTRLIGTGKGEALTGLLAARLNPEEEWRARERGASIHELGAGDRTLGWSDLRLGGEDPASLDRLREILDELDPSLVIVAMGRSRDDNFVAAEELRRRGILHITPTAFPGVTHYKQILTDRVRGPCYECLQGRLSVDGGAGATLTADEREMFYGGSQPATLAETYPSAHSLLRLALDLALPPAARPPYLLRELAAERPCFVGANKAEQVGSGGWLYGCDRPFSMVTYGVEDVASRGLRSRCSCGRELS